MPGVNFCLKVEKAGFATAMCLDVREMVTRINEDFIKELEVEQFTSGCNVDLVISIDCGVIQTSIMSDTIISKALQALQTYI